VLRCHKSTAAGIITELADAAVAPKWKEAMMKHMEGQAHLLAAAVLNSTRLCTTIILVNLSR
jgi:hypothetical protein